MTQGRGYKKSKGQTFFANNSVQNCRRDLRQQTKI